MSRVKLGLRNLSIDGVILKGITITFMMRNNPNFPESVPPLPEIKNCLDELRDAQLAARYHDKIKVAIRNSKQKKFLALLRKLGGWISSQTTDELVILSSGFDVIKSK